MGWVDQEGPRIQHSRDGEGWGRTCTREAASHHQCHSSVWAHPLACMGGRWGTETGSDLLPSSIDLSSVEEINSTFIGNCHQPFSNLQEDTKVSQKCRRKCLPSWEAMLNPLSTFHSEISLPLLGFLSLSEWQKKEDSSIGDPSTLRQSRLKSLFCMCVGGVVGRLPNTEVCRSVFPTPLGKPCLITSSVTCNFYDKEGHLYQRLSASQ